MIDFSTLKGLTIPEGEVLKITRDDIDLWCVKETGIPDTYQQVEWVKADANVGAYLDLGFAFDKGSTIQMGFYTPNTTQAYLFGAAENSGKLRCLLTAPYDGKNLMAFYGSTGSAYVTLNGATISLDVMNEMVATLKKGLVYYTNKTTDKSNANNIQGEYTMISNLYLFAQNYNGTVRYGSGIRQVKYFKYYDVNGDLICDLVPCYRKSDGMIGMYDIARETFLTNVGTGTFTKGVDVTN